MKSWVKKHPILLAFLLLGGSVGGLNYSGFCIPEGRWLSDEEFLFEAIKNRSQKMNLPQSEAAIKDFLNQTPQCCLLKKDDDWLLSSTKKALGLSYAAANIQYPIVGSTHLAAGKYDYYDHYAVLTACGKIVDTLGTKREKQYTRYKDK